MLTDKRLDEAIGQVVEIERDVRQQLILAHENASEQLRGQVAQRHLIGLRNALEAWRDTRVFVRRQKDST